MSLYKHKINLINFKNISYQKRIIKRLKLKLSNIIIILKYYHYNLLDKYLNISSKNNFL
jgi:uncharacterized UPF0160 family protein